ncbi:hypothetical protein HNP86_001720 [Methanococcus maripaludis]|uniref:DUF4357 domain-containing protein n=1 Tax=Methanococcus maripaludis TaxID=39152 RepID=A0A7J9NW64_METMI|nr:DUF4357 domain-containing protein [Methanococcus maripaludis]MBA2851567.1 hypothetical protein [Methanococcus maripaludis]
MRRNNKITKSIRVTVFGDISNAIRVYDSIDSIFEVYWVPYGKLAEFRHMMNPSNKKHESLYFLIGDTNDMGLVETYIGQSNDTISRLKNHDSITKFDWRLAICAVPAKHLGKECLKSLEKIAIEKARPNCVLINEYENKSYKPHPTNDCDAKILLSNVADYLTLAGYPILNEVEKGANLLYIYQNGEIFAEGEYLIDKLVVFKGSRLRLDNVDSMTKNNRDLKERLIKNGILAQYGDFYIFTKDYAFSSPSAAACVILGQNISGWVAWKDKDSTTLKELFKFE